MRLGWVERKVIFPLLLVPVACQTLADRPDGEAVILAEPRREGDSNVGFEPLPYAPLLESSRVYLQSLRPDTRTALITGLPGAAADGVTQVCARNRRSGAQICLETRPTADGPSFTGVLGETAAGDTVTLWAMPGGPGLNSIDKPVLRWISPFPDRIDAMALVRGGSQESGALLIGSPAGLYVLGAADFAKSPAETEMALYTTRDGLPAGRILAMLEAPGGGAWISTEEGMAHFSLSGEPRRFRPIATELRPFKLSGDGASGFFGAARDRLIHVTFPDGEPRVEILGDPAGLPGRHIADISPAAPRGLWIVSQKGLTRLVPENGAFRFQNFGYPPEMSSIPQHSSPFKSVREAPEGAWVQDGAGFIRFRFDGLHAGWERIPSGSWYTPGAPAASLPPNAEGGVWANEGRLYYLHAEWGMVMQAQLSGVPEALVRSVLSDGPGRVWVATLNCGLVRLQFAGSQPLPSYYVAAGGLPGNMLGPIASDLENGAWIGTSFRGVARVTDSRGNVAFETFSRAQGLADDRITALIADGAGGAWAGTKTGISRLRKIGDRTTIENFGPAQGVPNAPVNALSLERSGVLWAGTPSGLVRLMPMGDRFDIRLFTQADGLAVSSILSLAAGAVGEIWVGYDPPRIGDPTFPLVGRVTPASDGTLRVAGFTRSDGFADPYISQIIADPVNGAWLRGNLHLARATSRGDSVSIRSASLFDSGIPKVFDRSGALWVTKDWLDELGHLEEADGIFRVQAIGPIPAEIRYTSGLALRSDGGIWATTPAGLYLLSR